MKLHINDQTKGRTCLYGVSTKTQRESSRREPRSTHGTPRTQDERPETRLNVSRPSP